MSQQEVRRSRGLGRGLAALLGTSKEAGAAQVSNLPIANLRPGAYQPRTHMDEGALHELAESIKTQGIMQPILVRKIMEGDEEDAKVNTYEIIAGERRFRAAQIAGLEQVPVLVRQVDDQAAAAMALIENIQRENLNPLEEAQGLERLVQDFGLTHEQIAQAVGRSRSSCSNLLRLLQLAAPVQTMLMAGDIDMGHARALLSLDKAEQITASNQIAAQRMSVRQAEALVKTLLNRPSDNGDQTQTQTKDQAQTSSAAAPDETVSAKELERIEHQLSDLLLAQVRVHIKKAAVKRHGKMCSSGHVSIEFGSLDELGGLIERLGIHVG